MSDLELKLLDPLTDLELFREAFQWRSEPKKHVGANRMAFETFIADDPRQIVVGVFNGEFIAAFLLYEIEEGGVYDCHFTSKRGTPKELLIEGGKMVRDAFFENGAKELSAKIIKRNTALKAYLEALGFELCLPGTNLACTQGDGSLNSVSSERNFVKYAISRKPPSG